jgi:hypothetical protein
VAGIQPRPGRRRAVSGCRGLWLDPQFGELVEHLATALAQAREDRRGKGASDHAPVVMDPGD